MAKKKATEKWDDQVKAAAAIGNFKPGDLMRWTFRAITMGVEGQGPDPTVVQVVAIRVLAEGEVLFSFANPETDDILFSCMVRLTDLARIIDRVNGEDPLAAPA